MPEIQVKHSTAYLLDIEGISAESRGSEGENEHEFTRAHLQN